MNKLKEIRFYKRISQFSLAAMSGVHQSRISLFENDLANPSPNEKENIAKVLGMTPEEIFPEDQNKAGIQKNIKNKGLH